MSVAYWSLFVGIFLITMVLLGTLLSRVPLSSAMVYLCLGYALGPGGVGVISLDPFQDAHLLEFITEIALLISLFAVGLKLGVPILDRRWFLPLRLAFPSLLITVMLIAGVGVWGLQLSVGEAILLGGILAPTDPVLASGIQSESGTQPDTVRFGLAGEGAINDGSAFPVVLLGLGLMGVHDLGEDGRHWWTVDLFWGIAGGAVIGAILGAMIGKIVVYLRTRHHNAVGLDEFLSLGLIATAYGVAQFCLTSGFLAVFTAGLALHRVRELPMQGTVSLDVPHGLHGDHEQEHLERATHSHHASASMSRAVQEFNEQLEKLAELVVVFLLGALLPYVVFTANLLWFIPLLFFIIRPIGVWIGMTGMPMQRHQGAMIGWFGIRGVGSVFYLMYAISHGVTESFATVLISITLVVVTTSIVGHGVSVLPLMKWYAKQKNALSIGPVR